jgi:hypothetical protein
MVGDEYIRGKIFTLSKNTSGPVIPTTRKHVALVHRRPGASSSAPDVARARACGVGHAPGICLRTGVPYDWLPSSSPAVPMTR